MRVFPIPGIAGGYESLTTATAVGFTSAKIAPTTGSYVGKKARAALISIETAPIRFTLDGTTPTVTAGTAAGHIMYPGDSFVALGENNIENFRAINEVAASGAVVKCTYFF